MQFAFSLKIFRLSARNGITLALVLLHAVLFSGHSRASVPEVFQEPQQNQAAPEENPSQGKPTDSKKDSKPSDPTTTRLRIHVIAGDKPVGNASVYVRFPVTGGIFHKEKLTELNLKTNEDGSVKVPDIPRGRILIQVVAKGWKTYGKWYDIDSETMTVEIKLDPPAHWY